MILTSVRFSNRPFFVFFCIIISSALATFHAQSHHLFIIILCPTYLVLRNRRHFNEQMNLSFLHFLSTATACFLWTYYIYYINIFLLYTQYLSFDLPDKLAATVSVFFMIILLFLLEWVAQLSSKHSLYFDNKPSALNVITFKYVIASTDKVAASVQCNSVPSQGNGPLYTSEYSLQVQLPMLMLVPIELPYLCYHRLSFPPNQKTIKSITIINWLLSPSIQIYLRGASRALLYSWDGGYWWRKSLATTHHEKVFVFTGSTNFLPQLEVEWRFAQAREEVFAKNRHHCASDIFIGELKVCLLLRDQVEQ